MCTGSGEDERGEPRSALATMAERLRLASQHVRRPGLQQAQPPAAPLPRRPQLLARPRQRVPGLQVDAGDGIFVALQARCRSRALPAAREVASTLALAPGAMSKAPARRQSSCVPASVEHAPVHTSQPLLPSSCGPDLTRLQSLSEKEEPRAGREDTCSPEAPLVHALRFRHVCTAHSVVLPAGAQRGAPAGRAAGRSPGQPPGRPERGALQGGGAAARAARAARAAAAAWPPRAPGRPAALGPAAAGRAPRGRRLVVRAPAVARGRQAQFAPQCLDRLPARDACCSD